MRVPISTVLSPRGDSEEVSSDSPLAAFLNRKPREKGSRGKTLTEIEAAVVDAKARARSGDWEDVKATVFVGLYAMCHESTYGVAPAEMTELVQFRAAAKNASKLLADTFGGSAARMVSFIKWTWLREKSRLDYARKRGNAGDRGRIGWRLQFSKSFVTDYQVAAKGGR